MLGGVPVALLYKASGGMTVEAREPELESGSFADGPG